MEFSHALLHGIIAMFITKWNPCWIFAGFSPSASASLMVAGFIAAHLLVLWVVTTLFKQNVLNGGIKKVTTVSHFVTFGAIKGVCCVLEYKTSECSYSFSSSIKHFRITAYICLGFKIPRFEETSLLCNSKPDMGRELAFWQAHVLEKLGEVFVLAVEPYLLAVLLPHVWNTFSLLFLHLVNDKKHSIGFWLEEYLKNFYTSGVYLMRDISLPETRNK